MNRLSLILCLMLLPGAAVCQTSVCSDSNFTHTGVDAIYDITHHITGQHTYSALANETCVNKPALGHACSTDATVTLSQGSPQMVDKGITSDLCSPAGGQHTER